MNSALRIITEAGWGGVQVWCRGEGVWNGCLTRSYPDFRADHDTNLWDDQESPELVLEALVEKARRIGGPPQTEVRW